METEMNQEQQANKEVNKGRNRAPHKPRSAGRASADESRQEMSERKNEGNRNKSGARERGQRHRQSGGPIMNSFEWIVLAFAGLCALLACSGCKHHETRAAPKPEAGCWHYDEANDPAMFQCAGHFGWEEKDL
jgi:hypothetical protein